VTISAPTPAAVAWRRLSRVTGVAGLAAVVLILVPTVVGTRQEPTFDAAAIEVLTYYRSPHTPATQFRSFVLTIGLITFVWFVVALTSLRRAEGEAPWRSTIAMASGVLFVALALSGNEVAVAFRADDLDPQVRLR
jgi:magnesium-transporting ATPase (P-type)